METSYSTCTLCEANCGIEVTHEDGRLVSIRGDAADPFSQGHLCPKAAAIVDIQHDPDRLTRPLKRDGTGWKEIAWEQALSEVGQRLADIQIRHGHDAVAHYRGNPVNHNYSAVLLGTVLAKALDSRNMFSAGSVDAWPRLFTSVQMYGAQTILPIPDVDRTDHLLMLGANPAVSNGSVMTAPGMRKRLRAIRERGGKVVLIDPRRTETARLADEHHFIHPETDALLLLAMLHVVIAEERASLGRLEAFTDGVSELREIAKRFPPERVAERVGIEASEIRRLAEEFSSADKAVCYGRLGTCVQRFGTLASWLVDALNIVTGNFDRVGGAMFPRPAVDLGALAARVGQLGTYDRYRSRVSGYPEFDGEITSLALAEEIEAAGQGQIRGLITHAGNPALSLPNGPRLDAALKSLELLVCIDIYKNETARHAHYILPPTWGLEHDAYPLVFAALAVRNFAKYSKPVIDHAPGALADWEIQLELASRLLAHRDGLKGRLRGRAIRTLLGTLTPRRLLGVMLRTGPYRLRIGDLENDPHGVDLGAHRPRMPKLIARTNRRIDLVPEKIVVDLPRLEAELEAGEHAPLRVIGRRQLQSNNSWMHNSRRLNKNGRRCSLLVHPTDAKRLALVDGEPARISSSVGEIVARTQVSEDVMPGIVSLPHGWGHDRDGTKLTVASAHPGVSLNDVLDGSARDVPTGAASLTGIAVTVQPVQAEGAAE